MKKNWNKLIKCVSVGKYFTICATAETTAVFFHWFSTWLVSLCALWRATASFRSQGQVDSSLTQIPALPAWVSRVYRLYQLSPPFPLGALSILGADICFAPCRTRPSHQHPYGDNERKTGDSEDKDFQLWPVMLLKLGGQSEGGGGVLREEVSIVWQPNSGKQCFCAGVK